MTKFTVTLKDVRKCRKRIEDLQRQIEEAKEDLRITEKTYDEAVKYYVVSRTRKDEFGGEERGSVYIRCT